MKIISSFLLILVLFEFLYSGQGDLIWKFRLYGFYQDLKPSKSSPVVYNKNVYIGCDHLYKIDAMTGELIWSIGKVGIINSSVCCYSEFVYAPAEINYHGLIYALSEKDGSIIWKYDCSVDASTPAVYNNVLFVLGYSGFYAFNPINGNIIWKTDDIINGGLEDPPCYFNNIVFTGSSGDYHLYALKAGNGEIVWKNKTIGYGYCKISESLIIYSSYYYLSALKAQDGYIVWQDSMNCNFIAPCISNEVIYIPEDGERYLYAINANNGSVIWKTFLGAPVHSSACIAQDTQNNKEIVFIGSDMPYLHARDAKDGSRLWEYKPDSSIVNIPCVSDSIIYFVARDSYLYAVNIGFKDGFSNKQTSQHLPSPSLSAYPNPFKDRLNIESSDKARIYSITGQFITELDKGKHSIDTSKWREGIYIIKSASETKRIVKIQ